MKETVLEKLKVLAESAKYDVSCASSGVTRKHCLLYTSPSPRDCS